MTRTAAQRRTADRTLRAIKLEALRLGEARDGGLVCTCKRMRRRPGQAVGSLRYTFKLNGHVIDKIKAARWIDPENTLLY